MDPCSGRICPVCFVFGGSFVLFAADDVQLMENAAGTEYNGNADHAGTVSDLPHDKIVTHKRQKPEERPSSHTA